MSQVIGLWGKLLLNKVEHEKIADQVKAFLSCMKTVKDNYYYKIFCSSYFQKM